MKRLWKEIKEAFPFLFYRKTIKRYIWQTRLDNRLPPSHINCRCMSISLDFLGNLTGLSRLNWMDMPDIEKWKYRFDPTYYDEKRHIAIYYYIENDKGLGNRIEKSSIHRDKISMGSNGSITVHRTLPGVVREINITGTFKL